MPLQPLLGAFCAVLLCAAAGAAREVQLLVDPGPSAAGLYLTPNTTSPPIFHHQLYGPIGGAKSFYHLSQWNTPQSTSVRRASGGRGRKGARRVSPIAVRLFLFSSSLLLFSSLHSVSKRPVTRAPMLQTMCAGCVGAREGGRERKACHGTGRGGSVAGARAGSRIHMHGSLVRETHKSCRVSLPSCAARLESVIAQC